MASLIPVDDWPLLRPRMRRYAASGQGYFAGVRGQPDLLADVLTVVKQQGPLGAGAIEDELGGDGRIAKPRGGVVEPVARSSGPASTCSRSAN